MKHILMACGTGVCTSSAVHMRVSKFLDARGYAGLYSVTRCKTADIPALCGTHDFVIAATMLPATLSIPYVDGVPFLTGADASESERILLALMDAPERMSA